MTQNIVKPLMVSVVTADIGKLVETILSLAYSAENCKEKSKTLALKVELINESVVDLLQRQQQIDKNKISRLESVFKDAISLLQKYKNQSIFIKLLKAPFSEDGFDSVHKRLDICVEYFGFKLHVRNESQVSDLLNENRRLREMIEFNMQHQLNEMKRLERGELRSEESDEVNITVETLTLEDEVHGEHILCGKLQQHDDVLLMYSGELGGNELAILKRLSGNHVNILKFHGTYLDGKTKYAVMERPGKDVMTLNEFIKTRQDLKDGNWSLKKNLALEIGMGLQYAHTVGVLHKNIRSPNIFIAESSSRKGEYHPKIFGFKDGRFEAATSDKRPQSTEQGRWKAPEMLPQSSSSKRPEYSYACDVFSLGVVIWEIIAWSFPFQEFGLPEVLKARTKKGIQLDFEALPPRRSEALQSFMQVCKDCMDEKGGGRPSVDEVVERLFQLVPEDMEFFSA